MINKSISSRIIMAGDYYKNNHPGGISAVIQYWSKYIEKLQYYPIFRIGNKFVKAWYFLTSYIRMALRLILDKKICIIHLHTAADGSFKRNSQLLRLAKSFRKKVILHIHASRFKDFYQNAEFNEKTSILNTLKTADRIIVLSESWKNWFMSIGIEQTRLRVLHNITPHPLVKRSTERDHDKLRFLFLGEIGERKGIFDILKAISEHKNELNGKIELRIGGNKNEKLLQSTIIENGLAEMVFFEGWVSGNKKIELLNWADIYILPSHNEGLPISILEAMSYGCPIISSPVGGIPEVVTDNGIMVTPGNSEEIFAAIRKYIENPEKIDTEGTRSLEIVKPYLPENVMSELALIYDELIK